MALSCLCVITNDISSQYKELLHQQIEINTIISLAIINKTEIRRITMESCRRPDSVLFLFPPFGKNAIQQSWESVDWSGQTLWQVTACWSFLEESRLGKLSTSGMERLVDVQIVRESRICAQKCFGLSKNTIDYFIFNPNKVYKFSCSSSCYRVPVSERRLL